MKTTIVVSLAFLCLLAAGRKAQAVVPPPDGGYPNFTTAEGQNALFSLTTGAANTAVGWFSLFSDTEASFNTATGAGTLLFNIGDQNTAFGAAALLFNTTADENTAVGAAALLNNTEGRANTAIGAAALLNNATGSNNAAIGHSALFSNIEGSSNTAVGVNALKSNTEGGGNTATGGGALPNNTIGDGNTANGSIALQNNTSGEFNTAIGTQALQTNVSGDANTAIGHSAGFYVTGSGNVCVGADVLGTAGQNNTTRIRNIGSTPIIDGTTVVIGSTGGLGDGILGYPASSRRYKENIKPMDQSSERLFALKPVMFQAKGNMDPGHVKHYGLIAEDVAAVDSDLVVYNPEGKPESLRFNSINAMLLNEFLKEHRKVEKLEAAVADLAARLQQVSAQVQMNSSVAKVAGN